MPRGKYNILSTIARENIIKSIFSEAKGIRETGIRFNIPYSTIQTIVKKFEENGETERKPKGGSIHKRLTEDHKNFIETKLIENPSVTIVAKLK